MNELQSNSTESRETLLRRYRHQNLQKENQRVRYRFYPKSVTAKGSKWFDTAECGIRNAVTLM
jgi:hypothetical protein